MWERVFPFVDALALGCWSAVAEDALERVGVASAVQLWTVTTVGGGAIRDISLARVPAIFQWQQQLYATCSLVASGVRVLMQRAWANRGRPARGDCARCRAVPAGALAWMDVAARPVVETRARDGYEQRLWGRP